MVKSTFVTDFEKAFEKIRHLVSQYQNNQSYFESSQYQEAEVRTDFIDRFFEALGWDVDHLVQKNPYRQEVKIERSLGGALRERRADYAFYREPNFRDVQFYVEAKRPYADLDSIDNYFQAIRYGWSSETPIVVLSNFRRTLLLDCRRKPDPASLSKRCIDSFSLEDYKDEKRFSLIYYLLSREAVHNNSLSEFAEQLPKLKGRTIQYRLFKGGHEPIDESFLKELSEIRYELARAFHDSDDRLDGRALTESVQRTIDRLVFIRFLEDKLIEPEEILSRLSRSNTPWKSFVKECQRLNTVYNGIIFRPHPIVDDPTFAVDSDAFTEVCWRLSAEESPYNFDNIPVHVLGNIYERFLGTVIEVSGNGVQLTKKQEVRKSGGIYYTPEFVARYIVEKALGSAIGKKTPDDSEFKRLSIADIACGSGSFLIEALDFLFRQYADFYNENRALAPPNSCVEREDGLHLSLNKKREILVSHIYGIDIDFQAVEVAQLSLYLRLLEDETIGSTQAAQQQIPQTVLPSLDRNIVCGNSIIGTEDIKGHSLSANEELAINPLNIENVWPDKFTGDGRSGRRGFDVIVGNPPYYSIDATWGAKSSLGKIIKTVYPEVYRDKSDVLFYFMARATQLTRRAVCFIVSRAFLEAYKADRLRGFLANTSHISEIIDFQNMPVFPGVGITTAIFRWSPGSRSTSRAECFRLLRSECERKSLKQQLSDESLFQHLRIKQNRFDHEPWIFSDDATGRINDHIDRTGERVDSFLPIGQGMQTGANKVFALDETEIAEFGISKDWLRRRARNSDIESFMLWEQGPWLLFAPQARKLGDLPKGVRSYLSNHRKTLEARAAFKRGNCEWWNFTWPLQIDFYDRPRILCPYLAKDNQFAVDEDDHFLGLTDTTVIFCDPMAESPHYICGLLNSAVLRFRYRQIGKLKSGSIREYFDNGVGKLPIKRIDFAQKWQVRIHDQIVKLAKEIGNCKTRLSNTRDENRKNFFQRKLNSLYEDLNRSAFELYQLTDEQVSRIEVELGVLPGETVEMDG